MAATGHDLMAADNRSVPDSAAALSTDVDWTVRVDQALPSSPSTEAAWRRIASQTSWHEWRSESRMRGTGVVTTLIPPASEPLQAGHEYVVRIGRVMKLRCRVLESSCHHRAEEHNDRCVFDSVGVGVWGLVKGRFRFTFFTDEIGVVIARAEEKITALPLLRPSELTLEAEHRHTFTELDRSFLASG